MYLPSRSEIVAKTRNRLMQYGDPRLQMLLIVSLTGAIGFVASYLMLSLGITTIWFRYALAMGFAYLGFMGLLWVWLHTKSEDYSDIPDISGLFHTDNAGTTASILEAHGGTFGGGGASGTFEPAAIQSSPLPSSEIGLGDFSIGDVAEAEEFAIPIIVIILVAALFTLSAWIIYSAPMLLSELLVDGVLSLTLYKHLRKFESNHWLETALRHTYKPFIATFILVIVMGWAVHLYTPTASSMAEAIRNHSSAPN
jgi:hypothetical protein